MSKREDMIATIRRALTGDPNRASVPSNLDQLPPLGNVLPPIEPADLVPRFERELTKVAVEPHRIQARAQIPQLLGQILQRDRTSGVVLSRNPLLARLDLPSILDDLGVPHWAWPSDADSGTPSYRDHCFSAAAGITGVDFALAESGSLALSSVTEGAQLSSLAPPIHIAFYLRSQVVATLEEVLEGYLPAAGPSKSLDGRSIILVTGTSRTADIEQILIRGVHGPREVHAILVDDASLAAD